MIASASGGRLVQCAECCSSSARSVVAVVPSTECRRRSSGQERVCLKSCLFLERLRLASYGRPVFRNSTNPLRSTGVSERNLTLAQSQKVKVRLRLDHQIAFGEHHALLGSTESAGSWKNRVMMEWTEDGWVVDLEMDHGEKIEYKYIIVTWNGNVVWEHGANRVLVVPSDSHSHYEVISHWSATHETIVFKVISQTSVLEGGGMAAEEEGQPGDPTSSTTLEKGEESNIGSFLVLWWQKKEISSLRSNESSHERVGNWDTTGLDRPAKHIVEGDQKSATWWHKLDVVRNLVTGVLGRTERLESLINSSIYLKVPAYALVTQWINTGQIPCHEGGGHHRPNKYAQISRHIFRELERITSGKLVSPKEVLVVRKIHPCLPALKTECTMSAPLTRLLDIAHRNDIPHDLKSEIKHSIQNKLHRNARPEELVATEAILARVTKIPGEYSRDFVHQLKIFYAELKNFFNAGSLTEQLEGLRDSLDEQKLSVLEHFLYSKNNLDEAGNANNGGPVANSELLVGTLHSLTGLRAVLVKGLESGIRNDAPDVAIAMRQKWRLSEIGLEDYAFVLLSRYINSLECDGGANLLVKEAKSSNVSTWSQALGAVVLGIRQIDLSGWQQRECLAIENELSAWQSAGIAQIGGFEDTRLWAQRLKATLERTRRLAEAYTDALFQLYPKHAEKLGNAFGIPENSMEAFTESELRASLVFQLSRLVSLLLKATRDVSGSERWDALMPGEAIGTLIEVKRLVPGSLPSSTSGPVVLLVKEADGHEEIRRAGPNVAGVILRHELPHLSHLGLRARQQNVVFVVLDDEERVAELRSLLGKLVRLYGSSEETWVSVHDGAVDEERQLA